MRNFDRDRRHLIEDGANDGIRWIKISSEEESDGTTDAEEGEAAEEWQGNNSSGESDGSEEVE